MSPKKKPPKLIGVVSLADLPTHKLYASTFVTPKGRVLRKLTREKKP